MSKPLIGISTYLEPAKWGVWDMPAALLPVGYPRLVQAAGGLAAMVPPDEPSYAAEVVGRLDGLVVAGGADVDPVRYGAERDPRTGPPARERDGWELALIGAALASGTPLLGICRGMQLLNVARGGTLLQHLEGHTAGPGVLGRHTVRPVPGTRYASVVPEETGVPTYHHQAADRIGDGLVVSAYAADGTPEALELPGGQWVLGVQWHPEMGEDLRVMQALVSAAAAAAGRPSPRARQLQT
ncbi:gamma-glutamyl-gamma-aminobutyrate hydrolase [Streptomyces agglomeratus]|uniref:Gamma-glutamyl-gamma-aminobutyrate hydrolase n=1 Tax=Streptomyces agglomeratus TaxID=285458 RepID=A0A1E5PED9_9ACTN|nr:gamma-glutamyl-gamma-aminobutyrate hydrolase family protein [Streptomyces agglomeratus]OEJ27744.1 gamma-glutamyl-gamma-aminobutyrate hydrolase [Streptomyces agglomeratus]OEJ38196.1 gamma-glutamyl-gamma-aminobutyrate hydrolase [Streptomyces agglomeratus]OEJ47420.1 gamma-glutamyl-gamma-aminobutyrate hydrolase [Streptomyces agglomeratus]OEJ50723.1 gamma-glutamyl-gamma-aminobutyrate hydrolase [Streptomyces agglomeratus]OEJ58085.1 gamma-glutamyl-gamma-aminobutyrate hydrolase [Streptomyces agglom